MTPFLKETWNRLAAILFSPLHANGPADLNDCYTTGKHRVENITNTQQTTEDFSSKTPIPNNKARSVAMN